MSYVDERIVEMRFDNKQFERGIKTSLDSLDKLDEALKLEGSSKGLQELQKTANAFNTNKMVEAVDMVTKRFSILGETGVAALQRIVSKAVDAGESMLKSLTVAPVTDGFSKYEQKLSSVQQIMNATGLSVEEVEESLSKLNWYTDETSYSFSDMVNNIAKFTSSGIELPQAVTSMIGIANAAGLAGASVTDASHAMDGFSKAIAKGYIERQTWQWIRTAHMDTEQFKKSLIEAAEAEGTLSKTAENLWVTSKGTAVSVADFETALKEGWATTKVMNRALGEFGGTTEKIYDIYQQLDGEVTTSEIIDQLGDRIGGLGLKAFKASQEAKTFTDALNATKDAVSSGWMQTFQIIFGNFDEARNMWTDLANTLWDVFASSAETRNAMLETWRDLGGKDALLESLSNAYYDFLMVLDPVKEALEEVFPPITGDRLRLLTERLLRFTEKLIISEDAAEKLKNTARGLFSGVRMLINGFKTFISILSPIGEPIKAIIGHFLDLLSSIGNTIVGFEQFATRSEKIQAVLDKIRFGVTFFSHFITLIINDLAALVKKYVTVPNLKKLAANVSKILTTILYATLYLASRVPVLISKVYKSIKDFLNLAYTKTPLGSFLKNAPKMFSSLLRGARTLASNALKPLTAVRDVLAGFIGLLTGKIEFKMPTISSISSIFDAVKTKVGEARTAVVGFFTSLVSSVANSKYGSAAIQAITNALAAVGIKVEPLKAAFDKVGTAIVSFYEKLKNASSIGDVFKIIVDGIKARFDAIKKTVETFLSTSGLDKVLAKVKDFIDKLLTYFKGLEPAQVMLAAFTFAVIRAVMNLGTAFESAGDAFYNFGQLPLAIKNFFSSITKAIKGSIVMQVASAFTMIAGSLALLSKMDQAALRESAVTMGKLTVALGGMIAVIALLPTNGGALLAAGAALGGFGAAILFLTGALIALDQVNFVHLMEDAKALGIVVGMLTAAMVAIGFSGKVGLAGTFTLLSFAISIRQVVKALAEVSGLMSSGMVTEDVVNQLIKMMGALALLSVAAGRLGVGTGIGLMAVLGSLMLFRKILVQLADPSFNYNAIIQNIDNISTVFAMFGALMLMARLAGRNALGAAALVLSISVVLVVIKNVLTDLSELELATFPRIYAGLEVLRTIFRGLALVIAATFLAGKNAIKAAVGLSILTLVITGVVGILSILSKTGDLGSAMAALWSMSLAISFLVAATAATKGSKVGSLFMLTVIIGILATCIALLSQIAKSNPLGVLEASVAMAVALIGFGKMLKEATALFSQVKVGTLLAFGACIAIVVGALAYLSSLKDVSAGEMGKKALAIGVVVFAMSGAMYIMARAANRAKDAVEGAKAIALTAMSMVPMTLALTALVGVMSLAGDLPTRLLTLLGAFGALAGLFVIVVKVAEHAKLSIEGAKAITIASLALIPIAGAIIALQYVLGKSTDPILTILQFTAVLMPLGLAFAGIVIAANYAKDALSGAKAITLTALAMIPLIAVLIGLREYLNQGGNFWQSFGQLAALAGVMALVMMALASAANVAKDAIAGAKAMALASVSLLIAAGSFGVLSLLNFDNLIKNVWFLVGAIGAFAALSAVAGNFEKFALGMSATASAMFGFGLALMEISAALGILALLDPERVQQAAIALGIMAGVFVLLATVVTVIPELAAGIGAVALAFIGFGAAALMFGAGVALVALGVSTVIASLQALSNMSAEQIEAISNNINQLIRGIISGIINGFVDTIVIIGNRMGEILQAIITGLAAIAVNVIAFIPEMFVQIISGLVQKFVELLRVIGDGIMSIVEFLKDAGPIFLKIGGWLIDKLLEGLKGAWKGVTSFFSSLGSDIIKGMGDVTYQMDEYGNMIPVAVAGGIVDNLEPAQAAGTALGNELLDSYCETLRYASPPHEFYDRAVQVCTAVGSGVMENLGPVTEAGKAVGQELISNTSQIASPEAGFNIGDVFGKNVAAGAMPYLNKIISFTDYATSYAKSAENRARIAAQKAADFERKTGQSTIQNSLLGAGSLNDETLKLMQKQDAKAAALKENAVLSDEYLEKKYTDYLDDQQEKRFKSREEWNRRNAESDKAWWGDVSDFVNDLFSKNETETPTTPFDDGGKGGKGGSGGGSGSSKAEKETKVYSRQVKVMDFAADAVKQFNNNYGDLLTSLSDTNPQILAQQAVELLAMKTWEASLKTKSAEEIAEMCADSSKDIVSEMAQSFLELEQSLEQSYAGQMDIFTKFDTKVEQTGTDMLNNLKSQVHGFEEWSEDIKKLADRGLNQGLIKTLREAGPSSYKNVRGLLDMTEDELEEYNTYYEKSISLPQEMALDTIAQWAFVGAEAAGGFGKAISESGEPIEGASTMLQKTLQEVEGKYGFLSDVANYGATVGETLRLNLTAQADALAEDTSKVAAVVKDTLTGEIGEEKAAEIGKAVVDGLADGITENGDIAIDAIVSLAEEMYTKAKESLESHSPSKKFIEIGKFVDQGLAIGIEKNAVNPINAVKALAGGTIETMTSAAGRVMDILNGNLDLDPTIRPVLDLSNVTSGAGLINSLLSDQQYDLGAIGTIQNAQVDVGASVYSAIKSAFSDASGLGLNRPQVNITVYGAEGQDVEELADIIQYRINHEVNRLSAVWGGAT